MCGRRHAVATHVTHRRRHVIAGPACAASRKSTANYVNLVTMLFKEIPGQLGNGGPVIGLYFHPFGSSSLPEEVRERAT